MRLYGHWRSLATYRLRVALKLKNIDAEIVAIDLLNKEHLGPHYRAINPQGALPALEDGDGPILFQSAAIIEYLDETHPLPPLLPADPRGRARVRALSQIVSADTHPLVVPRVRDYLEYDLGLSKEGLLAWIKRFGLPAFETLESFLTSGSPTGRFCHGDSPTLADIMLASHVIGMELFGFGIDSYPRVKAVYEACSALDAFASAHPLLQPNAPSCATL
ncbi:MAG TPA: maleylacetoacetate isomerase [Afipia sp.]